MNRLQWKRAICPLTSLAISPKRPWNAAHYSLSWSAIMDFRSPMRMNKSMPLLQIPEQQVFLASRVDNRYCESDRSSSQPKESPPSTRSAFIVPSGTRCWYVDIGNGHNQYLFAARVRLLFAPGAS